MTQFLETCLWVKLSFILAISLQSSSSYLVTESLCCSHPAGRVVVSFHQRDSGTQKLYDKNPLMEEAMWITPVKISASEISGIQNCFCTFNYICNYFCKIGWPNKRLVGLFLKQFRPHHEEWGKVTCKDYIQKGICSIWENQSVKIDWFSIPINALFITDLYKTLATDWWQDPRLSAANKCTKESEEVINTLLFVLSLPGLVIFSK